jgi:hypothetical protein
MTVNEDNIIAEIEASTPFSVEGSNGTSTNASILYDSASKKQGNFTVFLANAKIKLAADIAKCGKNPSTAEQETLLAYLIASSQEKKDPDYAARSVSMSGYSVSRADSKTGYEVAYQDFLESLSSVDVSSTMSSADIDGKVRPNDDTYYPSEWRLSPLHGGSKRSTQDADLDESGYADPL